VLNFRKLLPTIMMPQEILDKAFLRVSKIDASGNSKFDMIKNKSIARINAAGDIVHITLMKYNRAFPSVNEREGFMVELMCVLVDMDKLKIALSRVEWGADKVMDLRRVYDRKIKVTHNLDELDNARKEYYGRVSSIVWRLEPHLKYLAYARDEFRKIPIVDEEMDTIVIAGFPNVGKSQLVDRISTAKPEIAAYPFTTQGIGIGVYTSGFRKFQIIDTPGLLDRPLEDRNAIELQAILALKYLSDMIVFIIDPSETAGYTIEQQERLLASVRENFPEVYILEVENKVDVLRTDSDRLKMSAMSGEGVHELLEEMMKFFRKKEKQLMPSEPSE
jgi:nucleolar GTP-binding protein